jgi:hypothetical protein
MMFSFQDGLSIITKGRIISGAVMEVLSGEKALHPHFGVCGFLYFPSLNLQTTFTNRVVK